MSAGNFALRQSPVPQILLSRNSLYTSAAFTADLLRRRAYRMWLDTKVRGELAKASIRWADVTVAPSEAFAAELTRWTGRPVKAIHHGFDYRRFVEQAKPLPPEVRSKMDANADAFKLLFVSHYNYYRNFETLFRALPMIRDRIAPRRVRLFLTCKLRSADNPGSYRAEAAAALVKELGIEDNVVELGTVPYDGLANLYRACDVYVTAAYAETFSHPLVEAMACGLPIVASDIAVHREIAGPAARFFPIFCSKTLTREVVELSAAPEHINQLVFEGRQRCQAFSWRQHAGELITAASSLRTVHSLAQSTFGKKFR
jgi:glycosyltransferase involved in cell wall biosynthesis